MKTLLFNVRSRQYQVHTHTHTYTMQTHRLLVQIVVSWLSAFVTFLVIHRVFGVLVVSVCLHCF